MSFKVYLSLTFDFLRGPLFLVHRARQLLIFMYFRSSCLIPVVPAQGQVWPVQTGDNQSLRVAQDHDFITALYEECE